MDVKKIYYLGYVYNKGPYSFVNSNGETVTGETNKYKLQMAFPVEGSKNTQSMAGFSVLSIDVPFERLEKVVPGGVTSLIENIGKDCECSFDRKGTLTYLRWGK